MTSTPAPEFTYFTHPHKIELSLESKRIFTGTGDTGGDGAETLISLELPEQEADVVMTSAEARELAALLINGAETADLDVTTGAMNEPTEGNDVPTWWSPRPGQTFPVSSPLDTLKHLVLSLDESLDFLQERVWDGDAGMANGENLSELIDGVRRDLWAALGEHVEGINPDGIGAQSYTRPDGTVSTGRAPGKVWDEVNRYDSGAPVRLNVRDGGTSHTLFTRLTPDSRRSTRSV